MRPSYELVWDLPPEEEAIEEEPPTQPSELCALLAEEMNEITEVK